MISRRAFAPLVLLLGLMAVACEPSATPTLAPTITLLPPTETFTPSPLPPTATSQDLVAPQTLTAATPAAGAVSTAEDPLLATDPIAADLVGVARRALATQLNLPTRSIALVSVQPVVWTDTSLGCPLPDQQYAMVETNGYRIVLLVGEREYIYHADFDRVIACDSDDEQLPEGVVLNPVEATAEATGAG